MARFDALARIYDLLPIPTHPEAIRERVSAVDGPGLDLGGGTARFSRRMHGDREPLLVADASRGMLERARRAGRPIAPLLADGGRLPLDDDAVAAATVTEAFHHFAPRQRRVLAELARVLRPDGVLAIEEIDPDRRLGRAIELGENVLMRFGSVFLSPGELSREVERFFGTVEVERTGRFTYVVEAREPAGR